MRDEYSKLIANRINDLLKKRHFSVRTLSIMSGVGRTTIIDIKNGDTTDPQIKTLHKLALAFNMTLAEFLDFPELNEYDFDDEKDDDE